MLSEHARAKRGDLVLEIDDALLDAIGRAQRQRRLEEGGRVESAALPSKRDDVSGAASGGRLSPREIQHRLRMGETVAGLAKSSGLDEPWIERFAAPVLAELERIVDQARSLVYSRPRAGASAAPLGRAVTANVLDKGVALSLDEIDAGWGARQRPEGVWCITFSYSFKGRRHTAEWDVDLAAAELTARNKLAGELAYRESDRPVREPAAAPAAAPAKPAARPAGPAKKAGGPKRPAKKAARKPAAPEPPSTSETEKDRGPVRQSLPGTSTEKPSDTPEAPPATPEPEPPAPEASSAESPSSSGAAGWVSLAHPPSPSPTPPAPHHEGEPPTRPAPPVVTGVQPSAGESGTAEPGPADRSRRTDPLGRRALFSQPEPAGLEEQAPAEKAGAEAQAETPDDQKPDDKKPAAKKAPARKAPARKSAGNRAKAKPEPRPSGSEPAPPEDRGPSSGSAAESDEPSGDRDKGSGGNGPVNLPRSAPVPEPPAG